MISMQSDPFPICYFFLLLTLKKRLFIVLVNILNVVTQPMKTQINLSFPGQRQSNSECKQSVVLSYDMDGMVVPYSPL